MPIYHYGFGNGDAQNAGMPISLKQRPALSQFYARVRNSAPPATQDKMCHLVERYLVNLSHFADYVYRIEHCVTCLIFYPNLKIVSLWLKVNLNLLCTVINRFNFA